MKNGIYRVTLDIDDRSVSGPAFVRDDTLLGLENLVPLSGVLGFAANDATVVDAVPASDRPSRFAELQAKLSTVRIHVEAMALMSISDREFAGEAASYVDVARQGLDALRARLAESRRP